MKLIQDTFDTFPSTHHLHACISWLMKCAAWTQGVSLSVLLPPEFLRRWFSCSRVHVNHLGALVGNADARQHPSLLTQRNPGDDSDAGGPRPCSEWCCLNGVAWLTSVGLVPLGKKAVFLHPLVSHQELEQKLNTEERSRENTESTHPKFFVVDVFLRACV